jgi:D-xylose 1-dehydrogenase (NADP+, D-xylono-1,5-lactone-forming)
VTHVPLRLGIVGCGWIADAHAQAAASVDDVAFVACADVRSEAADAWAAEHRCERAYGDYRTMVDDHDLDAVVVATWPNLHREHVLDCLDAGIRYILCEKSLALTGAEALEIWAAAREAGALVMEGFMYRHHPAIAQLDALLEAGAIGPLDHVSATFDYFDPEEAGSDDPNRDWRQDAARAGGVPWDLACYCVDACNRFAGARPVGALGVLDRSRRYGTVDRLYGLIEYENGVVGQVRSSKRADGGYDLVLAGAGGRLSLPVAWAREGAAEILRTASHGWAKFETERHPVEPANSFALQLAAFAAAARGEREPVPRLEESVVTAFTLDALLASGAERVVVDIELPAEVAA